MPLVLPGILELSRRARYFSFHAFLLDEYQQARGKVDAKIQGMFIKRAEWDFGLAVQRCRRDCSSSPVGARRLGSLAQESGPFRRGESVENDLGGYGLYYRSPMIDTGVVAGKGTLLGDEPIQIDVLHSTNRARSLASTFREAIAGTTYYRDRLLWTANPLPSEVIDEYAAVACLCQLRERAEERDAVLAALFAGDEQVEISVALPPRSAGNHPKGSHLTDGRSKTVAASTAVSTTEIAPGVSPFGSLGVAQRRRSVAHYLAILDRDATVVTSEHSYREGLWMPPDVRSLEHQTVAGQWSAVAAKDVWQEALCSVWSEFCRKGLARTRALSSGLTWGETQELIPSLLAGPPLLAPDTLTADLDAEISSGKLRLPGEPEPVSMTPLDDLRIATRRLDTATSGLAVVLELSRRMSHRSGVGWTQASQVASAWQHSVAAVRAALATHIATHPTVANTLWWMVNTFIVPVHERIAYSKLPEFTFRFRWEDGLLRFYDHGVGRFPLAAIRRESLAQLTNDLGLWNNVDQRPGPAGLTKLGRSFLAEVLR